ncbi:hypothetical protein EK0264_06295 [Epidermidibacterium keratini]|uniref:Permease n=1 Tax=Epidermidibacterium keratini TaxID=1891644 RepID=A0A7L4YLL7_9ACTN|nr:hypothetical protein [Epidermidibacterium keratini]QHB99931.1 hypothetical protein EK0264_06295 [Epidermidibacterium keratini]
MTTRNEPTPDVEVVEHDIHEHEEREDYARSRVPEHARRSTGAVFMVLVGIVTAFFFPTVGGSYLLAYGAAATWIALLVGFLILIALTLVVASAASREGLTAELLTRGCGYGFVGSVLTTLIYAATFVLYTALEGQILATSIDQIWDLPDIVWYIIVGLIFIPLTWYGMTQLTWIMWLTFPIYVILVTIAVVKAINENGGFPTELFTAAPEGSITGILGFLGVMAGLAGTIGLNPMEASDYNRFIAADRFKKVAWKSIVLPYALMFFVAMPLGMFFTLITNEVNPAVYFSSLLGVGLGVLLAWISQVRINLTNVHLGSIALTSAAQRVTKRPPGRMVWVTVVAVLSILLMQADVLGNVLGFLEWNGMFLLAWVGTVIADLLIVRKALGIVRGPIEYREGHIRKFNPVGVTALLAAVLVGSILLYAADGTMLRGLAPYIAFAVAVIVHSVMAVVTKGRFYFSDQTPEPAR